MIVLGICVAPAVVEEIIQFQFVIERREDHMPKVLSVVSA
jgi:hypothetical protein